MRGGPDRSNECPYAVLGVEPSASNSEIRRAYRRLAIAYHPDKNPRGREEFERISRAYEVIGDEDRRRAHDRGRRFDVDNDDASRDRHGDGGGGFRFDSDPFFAHHRFRDPFEIFREVFGDDFGDGRTGGIDPFREAGGVFGRRRSMFEDPFENDSFFGGRSAMSFGGSFGGMMGPTSTSQWSRSTTTTMTRGADGVTKTVSRTVRTMPDGSVVQSENITYGDDSSRHGPSIGGREGNARLLERGDRWR